MKITNSAILRRAKTLGGTAVELAQWIIERRSAAASSASSSAPPESRRRDIDYAALARKRWGAA